MRRPLKLALRLGRYPLALALTLGVAELGVRLTGIAPIVGKSRTIAESGTEYRISPDRELDYEFFPNLRGESEGGTVMYDTNAGGFRDVDHSVARAPGVARVAIVGDSVVAGFGLPKIADTLPGHLQSGWDGVEVLSFALPGYGLVQEARLVESKVCGFRPDVIVVVTTSNDNDPFTSRTILDRAPQWSRDLFRASELYRVLALRLDFFGATSLLPTAGSLRHDETAPLANRLERAAHGCGAEVLWMAWPDWVAGRPDDTRALQVLPPEFNVSGAIAQVFAESGGTADTLYQPHDPVHPSSEGSRLAAQAVRQLVASRYGASAAFTAGD